AVTQQRCPPLAHEPGRQLAQQDTAQVRRDVLAQQPAIKVRRAGTQTRPLSNPRRGVVTQPDLGAFGIGPLTRAHLRFDQDQRLVRIPLAFVGFGSGPHPPVHPRIADLVTARRELADIAETAMPIPVRHYAAPLAPGRMFALVSGPTRPSSMKSASAPSLIRT